MTAGRTDNDDGNRGKATFSCFPLKMVHFCAFSKNSHTIWKAKNVEANLGAVALPPLSPGDSPLCGVPLTHNLLQNLLQNHVCPERNLMPTKLFSLLSGRPSYFVKEMIIFMNVVLETSVSISRVLKTNFLWSSSWWGMVGHDEYGSRLVVDSDVSWVMMKHDILMNLEQS